jgi:hypothetical protein
MLKFSASIKLIHQRKLSVVASLICLQISHQGRQAHAQVSKLKTSAQAPSRVNAEQNALIFLASARLKSPDRNFESTTQESQILLTDKRPLVLQGQSLRVTLESSAVPTHLGKTHLLRINASGNAGQSGPSASFSAGTFKISDGSKHQFIFVEKSKGWLLEVHLRPVQRKAEQIVPPSALPVRPSVPTNRQAPLFPPLDYYKKPRRAPA